MIHYHTGGESNAQYENPPIGRGKHSVRLYADRMMNIEGRCFRVRSVFPADTETTITDKLLALIDTELEKDTRNV